MIEALGLNNDASFELLLNGPVQRKAGSPSLVAIPGRREGVCNRIDVALNKSKRARPSPCAAMATTAPSCPSRRRRCLRRPHRCAPCRRRATETVLQAQSNVVVTTLQADAGLDWKTKTVPLDRMLER